MSSREVVYGICRYAIATWDACLLHIFTSLTVDLLSTHCCAYLSVPCLLAACLVPLLVPGPGPCLRGACLRLCCVVLLCGA
ncbi:unnamed protein product [Colias eurytheme]|nr:unnamed protein product [Colias eurytheme]